MILIPFRLAFRLSWFLGGQLSFTEAICAAAAAIPGLNQKDTLFKEDGKTADGVGEETRKWNPRQRCQ